MVTAWRIYKPRYARTAFSGEGARLYGGRWNNQGTAIIYTSGSVSLAVLEMLVHLQATQILLKYRLCAVTFDEALIKRLESKSLPKNWWGNPAPAAARRIGDQWAAAVDSAVLQVPSAIIRNESNFLLNPSHSDFRKITIGQARSFTFDPRLA